jgi:hypothetical protein
MRANSNGWRAIRRHKHAIASTREQVCRRHGRSF